MLDGRLAEDRAAQHLLSLGYVLVTRRYRARGGEIDLVALDGETLVFVEVRYRAAASPEASVDLRKVERCAAAARAYVQATGMTEREVRFDLIAVDEHELRHHRDAFRPAATHYSDTQDEEP